MLRRTALFLLGVCLLPAAAQTAAPATPLAFEVATIRPNPQAPGWNAYFTSTGYHATGATLETLLESDAFGIASNRVSGGPKWMSSTRFNIEAKVAAADLPAFQHAPLAQKRLMLQALLAARFHLVVHTEARPTSVYALLIAKSGPKLELTPPERRHLNTFGEPVALNKAAPRGALDIENASTADLTTSLAWENLAARPVVDRTGLSDRYDIKLHWTPDNTPPDSPLAGGPSIFTAIEEQLGLKLEPTTALIDYLVIDHAEQPTEN